MRRKLLLGNWKMNKLNSEAKEFAIAAKPLVALARSNKVDLGVAPTYLSLATTRKYSAKSMIISVRIFTIPCHPEALRGTGISRIIFLILKNVASVLILQQPQFFF